jgi:Flp pilus assembly protein TadG
MRRHAAAKDRRHGAAAVEFAVCLPLMCLVLTGLWEVGRITPVAEVMWNSGALMVSVLISRSIISWK